MANAIKMISDCCIHQPIYVLWSRCNCGEPITGGQWRCATCALKAEVAWLEAHPAA